MVRVRFWGTRGSLATPGPTTLRYGGNTSCVEVRTADGTLIVLDCGTGAHGLGRALAASGERPVADRERATAAPTDGAARAGGLDPGTLRRPGEEMDGGGGP